MHEPLNETGQFGDGLIIRGRHYVLVDTISKSESLHRALGEHFMLRPYPIFVLDQSDPTMYKEKYLTNVRVDSCPHSPHLPSSSSPPSFRLQYTFVNSDKLPSNVHLLTFEALSSDSYLLRLDNFMETGDTAIVSLSVSVSGFPTYKGKKQYSVHMNFE